jgi:hypothetical protein
MQSVTHSTRQPTEDGADAEAVANSRVAGRLPQTRRALTWARIGKRGRGSFLGPVVARSVSRAIPCATSLRGGRRTRLGDLRSAVSAGSETRAEQGAGSETRAEQGAGSETRAEQRAGSETGHSAAGRLLPASCLTAAALPTWGLSRLLPHPRRERRASSPTPGCRQRRRSFRPGRRCPAPTAVCTG